MRPLKAIIFLLSVLLIFFLVQCIGKKEDATDPRGPGFVGSETCSSCHREIYDAHKTTNHFTASREADRKAISGSFKPGENVFQYSPDRKVVMEDRDSGLYQVAYEREKETEAHRFDIILGSRHAQTFLTWNGNRTFELPVSYYRSVGSWATSPGYSSHEIDFTRFINSDCFECHSSNIQTAFNGFEEGFEKSSLIYGIDCERCHGPAVNHVNFHKAYPDVDSARYIASIKKMTRQQKLDVCAVCHSGNDRMKTAPAFNFRPGDTLARFFYTNPDKPSVSFDVHGNQSQMLSESKCFISGKNLECGSCHNPHTNSSPDPGSYSKKCISCHQTTKHPSFDKGQMNTNKILDNCIDCHMPEQASRAISFQLQGKEEKQSYMLRTHKIGIYPAKDEAENQVKQITSYMNKLKAF